MMKDAVNNGLQYGRIVESGLGVLTEARGRLGKLAFEPLRAPRGGGSHFQRTGYGPTGHSMGEKARQGKVR